MKSKLKILMGMLLLIFSILIITPYFFEDKIVELIKDNINKNLNATVDFEDVDISLISNFPNAKVIVNNLLITTLRPFEGDTLAKVKKVALNIPLTSLFRINSGKIDISYFSIDEAYINILVNQKGKANYDIAKEANNGPETIEKKNGIDITLSLDGYKITASTIRYLDKSSNTFLSLDNFNHVGSGNLSTAISELKTTTNTTVSFKIEDQSYLNEIPIELIAAVKVDLTKNKYTFLENEAMINQLPLIFDGFIQLNERNQELDISFKTPSTDFKNFLALIPKSYSKDINDVRTTGNFSIKGVAKGIIDETHIPQLVIQLTSENASFKYPDLPKTIDQIFLNMSITNTTGIVNDTEIEIKNLSFKIDENTFNSSALISNIIYNPSVRLKAKGTIDLENVNKAFPMDEIKNLKGIVKADFETAFDMKSIEQKKYQNTKNTGVLSITDFKYEGSETAHPIEIYNSQVTFNPQRVALNTFESKVGNSDLKMHGVINNFIGFIFNEENIEGEFNLSSNNFDLSDFMEMDVQDATDENNTSSEPLKIPSFLNCTINANASRVIYDNLTLKDVKGTLIIKDETARIENLNSTLFDGKLVLDGIFSTKEKTPTFSLNLDVANFDIYQSFTQLDLFSAMAPIGDLLQGKINTDLTISGFLNDDLTPNLTTVNGVALSELVVSKTSLQNSKALSLLSSNLNFIDLEKIDLNDLKTVISFENGMVTLKPFNIKYKDIDIEIGGKHGLDQTMDYTLKFDVPAKYLGSDVSNVLASLSDQEKETITVPLSATIVGSFTNPVIKTDMTEVASNLTNQLLNQQKNNLINSGGDEIMSLLNGTKKSTDSTKSKPKNDKKSLLNKLSGLSNLIK